MEKTQKLIVFCGGTGGHFYPGLSVAREFQRQGGAVKLFLIGKHSRTQSVIADEFGIESIVLSALPPPVGILGKVKFLLYLFFRFFEARQHLLREKPDFVLGMGSFTQTPAVIAARTLRIPIFLHDGNSFIGKANLFLSRYTRKIGLAFPPKNAEKLKCSYELTGMPLRPEMSPEKVREKYGCEPVDAFNKMFDVQFTSSKTTVLVFGGSQGAGTFNSIIPQTFKLMERKDFQIIHISGAGYKDDVEEKYKNVLSQNLVIDGTEEMGLLFAVADLVICRAGGSTIAELALFGKSAILVPFPFATDDHQRFNAEYYTSAGNSRIIKDMDCLPAEFSGIILDWLAKKEDYAGKTDAAKKLAHPQAAEKVIKMFDAD